MQLHSLPLARVGNAVRSRAEFGSDYLVEIIRALGVEFAAFNPGSSFRGLHDSIVNFGGVHSPEVIECTHEEISVAIAHGYAKATGKPMVAIAHDVVGLQHATMAIFNAWVDRVPMMVLGGTGPVDAIQRRPWIDWMHTALVQGNIVRDYTKWDDQPASLPASADSLIRAYRLTTAEPTAPVYVCFDSTLQEMRVEEELYVPDLGKYPMPTRVGPDPVALERTADRLVAAERPVLVADFLGRNPDAVRALVALAEALGAPVLDRGGRFNMPTTHPLDQTGAAQETLSDADLVLMLDVQDPFGALTVPEGVAPATRYQQPPDATVITISTKDLLVGSWTSEFQREAPVDVAITADTSIAVPQLLDLVRERLVHDSVRRDHFSQRGAEWADRNRARRRQWRAEAQAGAGRSPLSLGFAAATIWDVIRDEDWALVNGGLGSWARRLWSFREPYQFIGTSGGAGLGYGMGASIGAALGLRGTNHIPINLQADGDLLMTPGALWTAAHHRVPMLTIIHNNRSFYNSEEHAIRMANFRERPVEHAGIGTQIVDPSVNYATLARGFGLPAEGPITDPKELRPAVERALRLVKDEGATVVVDVVCEAR
ncbi:MAG: acetolactate synthase large subunit [Chloroflexota bacterium]|nr:acetolactate synthase large subunit [Chloroflexota bacterium]